MRGPRPRGGHSGVWEGGAMAEQSVFERMIGAVIGAYRLEQLLGQDELGPIFQARNGVSSALCRLRLLPTRGLLGQEGGGAYLQEYARRIAALRHPYILPLLDFGLYRGMPYLVWPHVAMRPLSSRILQSGPTDVVTTGRYIDQIAAALEHAHGHDVLHLNLTASSVCIQLDGQLIVTDFGVRHLYEATATGQQTQALIGVNDACSPEQVLGRTVGSYTDVYALGALTVRLLTAHAVFTGRTREDVAQQHVYVQIPTISAWRRGLPAALDGVIAAAVAKDPEQRYQQAGAFANAYHDVVDAPGANRLPFVAAPRAETGIPGEQGPAHAQPPVLPAPETPASDRVQAYRATGGAGPSRRSPAARSSDVPRPSAAGVGRIVALVALVVALVAGGLYLLVSGRQAQGGGARVTGTLVFLDAPNSAAGQSNLAQVTIHGADAPAAGEHYAAWIIDTATESGTPLGTLSAQSGGFAVSGPPSPGSKNLIGAGDKVIVTLEKGDSNVPVGKVVATATFPAQAFQHVGHLLVSYPPAPNHVGLLVGVLGQARDLNSQAAILQNAAQAGNLAQEKCLLQSMIDIVEGSGGAHYHVLSADCAQLGVTLLGDGYGLLGAQPADQHPGYLDAAAEHASLAAQQADATAAIRQHAGHVTTALTNVKGWVTTLDADALSLRDNPGEGDLVAQVVKLADQAYHGVPDSPDQPAAPDAGKAGAITAYDHGQFMATLQLAPPAA